MYYVAYWFRNFYGFIISRKSETRDERTDRQTDERSETLNAVSYREDRIIMAILARALMVYARLVVEYNCNILESQYYLLTQSYT